MAIDMFDTRTMTRALEEMKPPQMFFMDTFIRSTEMHMSRYVDFDVYRQGRPMAPFVSPNHQGELVQKEGFITKTYKPPYIKMKTVTTTYDLYTRQFGNHIYAGNITPAQRAAEQLGKDMMRLQEMIVRRKEWMTAQALLTGGINIIGKGFNETVDFNYDPTHLATVGTLWSNTSADPVDDLLTYQRMIMQHSGLHANIAILGKDTVAPFLARLGAKLQPSQVKIDNGQINPNMLPNGVTYLGMLLRPRIDLYTYDAYYKGDTDQGEDPTLEYELMPADKVLIGSTSADVRLHYGLIEDLDITASVAYYPKVWKEEDPSAQILMIQSAPLPVIHQPDAFAVLTVI